MKHIRVAIMVTCGLIIAPNPSYAILGVGDIVSDPASYSYYAKQLIEAKKNYEELVKSYEELQNNTAEIVKVKNSMVAVYNTITNPDEVVKNMKESVLYDAEGISQSFSKDTQAFVSRDETRRAKMKDWQVVDGAINETWGLNGDGSKGQVTEATKAQKDRVRQLMIHDSLLGASTLLNGWAKRSERIGKLTDELQKKKSVAEQQAFSNRLLLELIYGQQDLIRLTALMAQAAAAQDYEGTPSQTELDAKLKSINEAKKIQFAKGGILDGLPSRVTDATVRNF